MHTILRETTNFVLYLEGLAEATENIELGHIVHWTNLCNNESESGLY